MGQIGLMLTQTVAVFHGELAAEEAADQKPEMMLPVVELLQPGALVDVLFGAEGGSVVEAVQVGEAGEEFCRVLHPVDAELQLIDVLRVEMDGGFFVGSEAAVGAEVEGDRSGRRADARAGAARAAAATRRSIAFAQNVPTVDSEKVCVFVERAPTRVRVVQQITHQQAAHFAFAMMNGPGVIDNALFPTNNHGVKRRVVTGSARDIIR